MAAQKGLILVDANMNSEKGLMAKFTCCDDPCPIKSGIYYLKDAKISSGKGNNNGSCLRNCTGMADGEWFYGEKRTIRYGNQRHLDDEISERYIELYEGITGEKFVNAEKQ